MKKWDVFEEEDTGNKGARLKSIDMKEEKEKARRRREENERNKANSNRQTGNPVMAAMAKMNQQFAMSGVEFLNNLNLQKPNPSNQSIQSSMSSNKNQSSNRQTRDEYTNWSSESKHEKNKDVFPYIPSGFGGLKEIKSRYLCLNGLFKKSFPDLEGAEFIIIRSSNNEDLHKAVKYGVWSSSQRNNNTLYHAYLECEEQNRPIYLFFTKVKSGQYAGVAKMVSQIDPSISFPYWKDPESYQGVFNLKWLYVQNVGFDAFSMVTQRGEQVTKFRDSSRLEYEVGKKMMEIFYCEAMKFRRLLEFPTERVNVSIEDRNKMKDDLKKENSDMADIYLYYNGTWILDHILMLDELELLRRNEHQKMIKTEWNFKNDRFPDRDNEEMRLKSKEKSSFGRGGLVVTQDRDLFDSDINPIGTSCEDDPSFIGTNRGYNNHEKVRGKGGRYNDEYYDNRYIANRGSRGYQGSGGKPKYDDGEERNQRREEGYMEYDGNKRSGRGGGGGGWNKEGNQRGSQFPASYPSKQNNWQEEDRKRGGGMGRGRGQGRRGADRHVRNEDDYQ